MTPSKRRNAKNSPILAVVITIVLLVILVLTKQISIGEALSTLVGEDAPVIQTVEPAFPDLTASDTPVQMGDQPADKEITETPEQIFDYYVLALSWSPDYCATEGDQDTQQCSLGKKLGFVLHGLWPQFERGYPSSCSNENLPAAIKKNFPGLYPSDKLYAHEWEKHGTCSGLSPEGYLALSSELKATVKIPLAFQSPEKPIRTTSEDVQAAFTASNKGLDTDSVAVYCSGDGRFLKEVYICFNLAGQFRTCSLEILKKADRSCGSPDFLVRNVR